MCLQHCLNRSATGEAKIKIQKKVILFFLLIIGAVLCSSQMSFSYTVVLKKNGKTIQGDLVGDDSKTIILKVDGLSMSFPKENLDLDKMKELNAAPKAKQEEPAKPAQTPPPPLRNKRMIFPLRNLRIN